MNRCSFTSRRQTLARQWGLALSLLLPACFPAAAQSADPQRIPPMAASAQRGVLQVLAPPEVLLNGQPARLAPGARIRDRNNLMVVSGALIGQPLAVRYTRDPLGLLHEVWVLTAAEAAVGLPPPPALSPY